MSDCVLSVLRVGGGEEVKYSLCFSMRKSRLLMRKRLNSDRFYSYAMLVLLCRLTIVTMLWIEQTYGDRGSMMDDKDDRNRGREWFVWLISI